MKAICGKEFEHQLVQVMIAKLSREQEKAWLPVWAHLIDVAGIIEKILDHLIPNGLYTQISQRIHQTELKQLCIFLALTHDIGKLTPVFQSKLATLSPELRINIEKRDIQLPITFLEPEKTPHAMAGEAILLHFGCPVGIAAIVGSHHGKPQGIGDDPEDLMLYYEDNFFGQYGPDDPTGERWEKLWQEWLQFSLIYCGYDGIETLPELDIPTQLLVSGLLIMADWIASNTKYFPLLEIGKLGEGLQYPNRVETAWKQLNLPDLWISNTKVIEEQDFRDRFGFVPNCVQQSMIQCIQSSVHPGIFILEAQMGVGKTEAALAAAELLAFKTGCGGLFFGLPTQATANGIFKRLEEWARKQSEQVQHGIRLAHGMAELNENYQTLFHGHAAQNEDSGSEGLIVHSWFEGRKQALLCDFVIGTVDQLLMAALKQKHVMLRHLGLAGKVVVIDECHAYDAYMNCYLERALNWLGEYGIPVVLLSATLPSEKRVRLIQAYLNHNSVTEQAQWQSSMAYPLLTWTDGANVRQCAIEIQASPVKIKLLKRTMQELPQYLEAAKEGCIGMIVNTVQQAQQLAKELSETQKDRKILLIHARMMMTHRAERESEILTYVGKNSTVDQRKGLIIVGTQILEQSLDIDFDLLVTQLCPMDLLLQRMGRLHRHKDRIRPKELTQPMCIVLDSDMPDEGTKHIYGSWLLQRTESLLPEVVELPNDISHLVQSTYQDITEENGQWNLWQEFQMAQKIKKQKASQFLIPEIKALDDTIHGLLDDNLGEGEWVAQASVRDGDPRIEVLIVQLHGDGTLSLLTWGKEKKEIPRDRVPSYQECNQLLRQRLQLPASLCGRNIHQTTFELERMRERIVPEWKYAGRLNGELFLFLNEQGETNLCGYCLTYSKELGLLCERKEH